MPEPSTLFQLEDRWVEQWRRADEICRLLEDLVPRRPRRDERPALYVVRDEDDDADTPSS